MWCCDVTVNSESAFWIEYIAGLCVCSVPSGCHIYFWAVTLIEMHLLCVLKASIPFRRSWLPNVYSREFLWAASEYPQFSLSLSEWSAITMKREHSWSCCSDCCSKTSILISVINVKDWSGLSRINTHLIVYYFFPLSQPREVWPLAFLSLMLLTWVFDQMFVFLLTRTWCKCRVRL